MPIVAGWIDEMRGVFGADEVNSAIRNGMAGNAGFHARENGFEVGTEFSGGCAVDLNDMVLINRKDDESNARRRK